MELKFILTVIASKARQSAYFGGLLRSFLPRNDKVIPILFSIILLIFSACSPLQKSAVKKQLSENDKVDLTYLFYNANKEKILGNYDMAASLFGQCIRMDGSSDASMYELAQIYEKQSKFKDALFFIKAASSVKPDNVWYQISLAEILQANKLYGDAASVYEKLLKRYPDRVDYYYDLATALLYGNKIADAIKVYDKLESEIGVTQEVSVQKEKLYIKLGKIDKAVNEIQKLINSSPQESQYYGMLAELYQANGMSEKALEVYKKIQSFDPENPFVHLSLADYYRSNGNKEKSFEELKTAFSSKRLDLDTKINILSSYYLLIGKYPEMKDQALELNKLLIETHPAEARTYAVYGDFLYRDKKFEDARTQYRKASEMDKQNFLLWQQLLIVEADLSDFNSMLSESEEALTLFPTQPTIYLFNGIAKIQNKKYQEAIDMLNSGLKLVVDNNPLLGQFYSNLGDANYKLKNLKESDLAFDKSLEFEPKNTYVLNNYGYYLSLRNDSLEKAERMSLLSNQIDSNNSSFQDTYAWILYKQARFNEAKKWLEKAMINGGDKSAVILEHYGDVLYKLGDIETAINYWQKAQKAGKGSDFLEQKIIEKKLIE